MPYKKGQSGNPAGRAKGSKNRRTIAIERALTAKIEDIDNLLTPYLRGQGSHTLQADFDSEDLTPRDRLMIAERLMQYRFPKMQSTSVDLTARTQADLTLTARLTAASLTPSDLTPAASPNSPSPAVTNPTPGTPQ